MPAILEDADWDTWLGQNDATPDEAKAVLRTMEGVNWKAEPEKRRAKEPKPAKPDKSPPELSLL